MKYKVMVVYGTRPEAIKVAPLIRLIATQDDMAVVPVSTGQHKEMLDHVNQVFEIVPKYNLDVFQQGQSLNELSAKLLQRLSPVLQQEMPDALLVQGDTTSVAVSALAAFNMRIPVVHLEAGLRSGDLRSPFPEEGNRKLVSQIADLHLAPTAIAAENLIREGVDPENIAVIGNTVIDALKFVIDKPISFHSPELQRVYDGSDPLLLLTCHRRENWGTPMQRVGQAVAQLADKLPNWKIVFPVHANPQIRDTIQPYVKNCSNVLMVEALNYSEFSHLLRRASIILSDSGGIQEEAPTLGKPVLVLRDNTERPEAVSAGTVKLIGTQVESIVDETLNLIYDEAEYARMSQASNPYGSGDSSQRGVDAIRNRLMSEKRGGGL